MEGFMHQALCLHLRKVQPDLEDEGPLQMTCSLSYLDKGDPTANRPIHTVAVCFAKNVIGNKNCKSNDPSRKVSCHMCSMHFYYGIYILSTFGHNFASYQSTQKDHEHIHITTPPMMSVVTFLHMYLLFHPYKLPHELHSVWNLCTRKTRWVMTPTFGTLVSVFEVSEMYECEALEVAHNNISMYYICNMTTRLYYLI